MTQTNHDPIGRSMDSSPHDPIGPSMDSSTHGPIRRSMDPSTHDPIRLEILWQSLISVVNEQARALQRAAFSPIVARGR